jgi:cytochrome c biogenesis protein CcdA
VSSIVLSFFAGTLSVLSPCVLPVPPIVVASAIQRHPQGPLALAAGVVVSSTALGLFFASFAFVIDVDRDIARSASGVLMAAIGVTLLVPQMQGVFARVLAPVAQGTGTLTTSLSTRLIGQFILGVLLGAVWTPCTGPTLAAAVTLAARSEP